MLSKRVLSVAALGAWLIAGSAVAGENGLTKEESLAFEAGKENATGSPAPRSSGLRQAMQLRAGSTVLYESEPNNQPAEANLAPAAVHAVVAAVSPIGDVDYIAVSLPAGVRGFLSIDGTDGTLANGDSILEVRAADGLTVVESDDDNGPVNLSSGIAGIRLQNGGLSYIRVAALGSSLDPYLLFFSFEPDSPAAEVEPNDSLPNANALDGLISGTLGPGDSDWFAFPALVGDLILLAVDPNPDRLGSDLDPALAIYDPAGNLLRNQDVNGRGQPEFLNLILAPVDGVYTARLGNTVSATGSYLLSIEAVRLPLPVELLDFQALPG
jgi:hypothetical protein